MITHQFNNRLRKYVPKESSYPPRHPEARAEIIAVAAQILNLERFRIWSRVLALTRELSGNTC